MLNVLLCVNEIIDIYTKYEMKFYVKKMFLEVWCNLFRPHVFILAYEQALHTMNMECLELEGYLITPHFNNWLVLLGLLTRLQRDICDL